MTENISLSRKPLLKMSLNDLTENKTLLDDEMTRRGLGMLFGITPRHLKSLTERKSLSRKRIPEMLPDELLDNEELIEIEIDRKTGIW